MPQGEVAAFAGLRVVDESPRGNVVPSQNRLLWGETILLLTAGVVLRFAAHAALAGRIRPVLYEVQPSNPVALTSALLLVTAAAFLAALPPLLRAIRIDPAAALRQE